MSRLTILEQFAIVRGARWLLGAHGMGFTHTLFHGTDPLTILEIFHPTLGTDAYAMMSKALGFNYEFLVGDDMKDNRGSYKIDPRHFIRKFNETLL